MVALDGLTVVSGTVPEVEITGGMSWPTGDDAPEPVTLDTDDTTDNPEVTVALTPMNVAENADPQVPVGSITITLPADTDGTVGNLADHDEDTTTLGIEQGLKAGTITITIQQSDTITTMAGRQSVTAIVTVDADGAGDDTDPAVGLGHE